MNKAVVRLLVPAAVGIASLSVPIAEARAECIRWSADGVFKITQANGFSVTFTLVQRGQNVSGFASTGSNSGGVEGFIQRNRFNVTVNWNGGSVGVYTGYVDDDGDIVDGRTYDRTHPESWSTWTNTTSLKCLERR